MLAEACVRRHNPLAPKTGQDIVLLTNQFTFSPVTIAAIFRERWQIELLFKAPKQNLMIKTFVGTSANALHIQIWTALIALLLLKYLQLKSRWAWSLSNLVALLPMNLFVHRDLWAWLDQPFVPPESGDGPQQASWTFAWLECTRRPGNENHLRHRILQAKPALRELRPD